MEWKTLQVAGLFALDIPEHASYRIDESNTLVVRLPTECATEVLASQFHFRQNVRDEQKFRLEEMVTAFCELIVKKPEHNDMQFNVRTSFDEEKQVYMSQGVITWEENSDEHCWVVRGYCKQEDENFYLVHWNGLKKDAFKEVIVILESFKICTP